MVKDVKETNNYIFLSDEAFNMDPILECMDKNGFAVIRGLFAIDYLDNIVSQTEDLLKYPSIAGSIGYTKIDHAKKLIEPRLLGKSVVNLLVNETIVGIVESLFRNKCVLAETFIKHDKATNYSYFPLHSDFSEGWKKSPNSNFSLKKEHLDSPVGIGGIIYFHDTTDGAFCYSSGSHKLKSCYGQKLSNYPPKLKKEILENLVKIKGKKGDVILFNDIGFHGPDQPSKSDRLCLILDYYNVNIFGHKVVKSKTNVSLPYVSLPFISELTSKQQYIMGIGSKCMEPTNEYSQQRIYDSPLFNLIVFIINNAFIIAHIKSSILQWIKKFKDR